MRSDHSNKMKIISSTDHLLSTGNVAVKKKECLQTWQKMENPTSALIHRLASYDSSIVPNIFFQHSSLCVYLFVTFILSVGNETDSKSIIDFTNGINQ